MSMVYNRNTKSNAFRVKNYEIITLECYTLEEFETEFKDLIKNISEIEERPTGVYAINELKRGWNKYEDFGVTMVL